MKKNLFHCLLVALLLPLSTLPALGEGYVAFDKLLKKALEENLSLPAPQPDGRYQSLNRKGSALPKSNKIIDAYISYTSLGTKSVLHIDAKFGHIALDILKAGDAKYTVTDADERHLAITAKRAQKLLPKSKINNMKLFHGAFPEAFKNFDDASFSAVLLDRTLHFHTPEQSTLLLKEAYRVLKPGGKIFVVAITPYVKRFESFIHQYKQRLILKHQHPGYVKNLKYFINPMVTTPEQMKHIYNKGFLFFDAQFMHTFLFEAGFMIEKVFEFPLGFKSATWELDGREYVGAIAKKPLNRSSYTVVPVP